MKISKLFHWLYAIVLLLPVFSIGGKILYATFNHNAHLSYSNVSSLRNITISSETTNYIGIGKTYSYDGFILTNTTGDITNNDMYYFTWSNSSWDIQEEFNLSYIVDGIGFTRRNNQNYAYVYFHDAQLDTWVQFGNYYDIREVYEDNFITKLRTKSFEFVLASYNDYKVFYLINKVAYTTNVIGKLDNVFYYAVEQLNEEPIFAWAQDSFLVEPIAYVSELFGLSNTSPLITLLSYWLNMSIIWLCFDIIMYVPLMAHRWLDKGAIE